MWLKNAGLVAILSITAAAHSAADDVFRIPGPEEIQEAFDQQLIDYEEYRELLEVIREASLSASDSALIRNFSDLQTGFSGNPLFAEEVEAEVSENTVTAGQAWRHNILLRQQNRLNRDFTMGRMIRTQGRYNDIGLYLEYENMISGRRRWSRRYVSGATRIGGRQLGITVGNFRRDFGLGVMYGYHGRLMNHDDDRDESEKLLFSDYGGSNGIELKMPTRSGEAVAVYSQDRSNDYRAQFAGTSLPLMINAVSMSLNAGYGEVRNRVSGKAAEFYFFGASGIYKHDKTQIKTDFAAAPSRRGMPAAGAVSFRNKRGRLALSADGWSYADKFPALFSGGPSSRRYRTRELEEIGFAYRDRFRGETGTVVKSSLRLAGRLALSTSLGYAFRAPDDNRSELRVGMRWSPKEKYAFKLDCYLRRDILYSADQNQKRIQAEVIRHDGPVRSRLVIGYRDDNKSGRNDFLFLLDNSIDDRFGKMSLTIKFDRIRWSALLNRYLYLVAGRELKINYHLRSAIVYSYRYLRGSADNYATIRWELNWIIK